MSQSSPLQAIPGRGWQLLLLPASPHRMGFLIGGLMLLASVSWWPVVLRWGWSGAPQGPLHAMGLVFGAIPGFVFGFLMVVFPRWVNLEPVSRSGLLTVFGLLAAGAVTAMAGAVLSMPMLAFGLWLSSLAWAVGLWLLGGVLWRASSMPLHGPACMLALLMGLAGVLSAGAWAWSGDARWWFLAISFAVWGFLLPLFMTVTHRMVPFFGECAVQGYRVPRRPALLVVGLAAVFVHLGLEIAHAYYWLFVPDLLLLAIVLVLWWGWQPWRCRSPSLLAALHLAYAWLPLALAMLAGQSLWFRLSGSFVMGRAPLHALTAGFFTSMLVAMVTRVSLGHSGRRLEMPVWIWRLLWLLQIAVLCRIAAELMMPYYRQLTLAASLLLAAALAPWCLWLIRLAGEPRIDGRPG